MVDLVTVAPGHQLAPAPAASYLRARAAGCPAGITSSYRDPARQARMRAEYLAAKARGQHVAFVAAVEDSEHVTGYALDLPEPARSWMRANGAPYGWKFTDPTEAWHVAYRLVLDRHATDLTPPAPIAPRPLEDDDMTRLVYAGTAGTYLLDGGRLLGLDPAAALDEQHRGTPALTITPARYLEWKAQTSPGVLARSDNGSVAISLGGAGFVAVPTPAEFDKLKTRYPVEAVSNAVMAELLAGAR